DCPSIIICISVIRSLNGRGLFHATSLMRLLLFDDPPALSHRPGFIRHGFDGTQRRNVTNGREKMAGR
ncbi:hypothetical protein, partial [Rhizobium leguminosarum]|uniref:hypothetical protein n=1 Tax=Rhizobium leguminosarum TaxID=384 RepID=UPI0024A92E34